MLIEAGSSDNTIGGTGTGRGNVISGNGSSGILIYGKSDTTQGNKVQGNFIGTNADGTGLITWTLPDGTPKQGNDAYGVDITGGVGNIIGGPTTARNIISGNRQAGVIINNDSLPNNTTGTGNFVQGNYIGTDKTGTTAISNANGVVIRSGATDNTVGVTATGAGNVISGNKNAGVLIHDANTNSNKVQGNFIGTNEAGTAKLTSSLQVDGVRIDSSASDNTIGGATLGERNIISGNAGKGVYIQDGSSNKVQGNYIGTNASGTSAVPNGEEGVYVGTLTGGAQNNTIGGSTSTPGKAPGNVISGNTGDGVVIIGSLSSGNSVQGNIIGLKADGSAALKNNGNGMVLTNQVNGNFIGGTTSDTLNVISGNQGNGVVIASAQSNTVHGNKIGINAKGTAFANGANGVYIAYGASGSVIGGTATEAGNTIAFNGVDGVRFEHTGTAGNAIRSNSIYGNTGLGINLVGGSQNANTGVTNNDAINGDPDTGPNNLQNYPVLNSNPLALNGKTTLTGTFNSTPNIDFDLDFYRSSASDPGTPKEGEIYIGTVSVHTDVNGDAVSAVGTGVSITGKTFTYEVDAYPGQYITATATRTSASDATGAENDTSEFSAPVLVAHSTPKITGFTPASGKAPNPNYAFAGTPVTINGSNLSGATKVYFANAVTGLLDVEAPITSNTDLEIKTTVPRGARTGRIKVVTQPSPALSDDTADLTPPNFIVLPDDIYNAQPLPSTNSGALTPAGSNVGAGKEPYATNLSNQPNEPNHAGNAGGHSVWYSWKAPVPGKVTFDTKGSGFDTLLAIYTNTATPPTMAGLRIPPVVANDDDPSLGNRSSVTFRAVKDVTYYIAVDGYSGLTGTVKLNWSVIPDPVPNIKWINPSGGLWSVGANWNTGMAPGPNDVVGIDGIKAPGTYTVTLNVSPTVKGLVWGSATSTGTQTLSVKSGQKLTIDPNPNGTATNVIESTIGSSGNLELVGNADPILNGILENKATLNVDGEINWLGGQITGTATVPGNIVINPTGVLWIKTAGLKTISRQSISNNGTINWRDAGDILGDSSVTVGNYTNAKFTASTADNTEQIFGPSGATGTTGSPVFNNSGGTFTKLKGTGASGKTLFKGELSNLDGKVAVEGGTVTLEGGGLSHGVFSTDGTGNDPGVLEYSNNYTFDKDKQDTSAFTGTGKVKLLGKTVSIISGATLNNQSNVEMAPGTVIDAAGTYTQAVGSELSGTGKIQGSIKTSGKIRPSTASRGGTGCRLSTRCQCHPSCRRHY